MCFLFSNSSSKPWRKILPLTFAKKEKPKKGQRPCIFCNLFDHTLRRCFKFSDAKIKRNILKRSRKYFVCLEISHLGEKGSSDYKCYKCQGNEIFLFVWKRKELPSGKRLSLQRRSDVSVYVPVTSQIRLKWNIQRRLGGTSPRCLRSMPPWRFIGTSWRRLKRT